MQAAHIWCLWRLHREFQWSQCVWESRAGHHMRAHLHVWASPWSDSPRIKILHVGACVKQRRVKLLHVAGFGVVDLFMLIWAVCTPQFVLAVNWAFMHGENPHRSTAHAACLWNIRVALATLTAHGMITWYFRLFQSSRLSVARVC
jgi:hypothetical protein